MHKLRDNSYLMIFFYLLIFVLILSSCKTNDVTQEIPSTLEKDTDVPTSISVQPSRTLSLDRPDTVRETSVAATQQAIEMLTASPVSENVPEPTPTSTGINQYLGPVPEGALARIGKGWPQDIDISSEGQNLVVGTELGVFIYEVDSKEQVWFTPTGGEVARVTYSSDDQFIAASSGSQLLMLDSQSGELIRQWRAVSGSGGLCAIALAPNNDVLATLSSGGRIVLWNVKNGDQIRSMVTAESSDYCGIDFSPDGNLLASVVSDTLEIWNPNSGKWIRTKKGEVRGGLGPEILNDVSFSPDGESLLTGNGVLWDSQTGEEILRFTSLDLGHVAFSSDGKKIASNEYDTLILWDRFTGERIWEVELDYWADVSGLQFFPDGETLAVPMRGESIQFLDVRSGESSGFIQGHFDIVGFGFSSDSRYIASWDWRNVRLWDAESLLLDYTFYNAELSENGEIQSGYNDAILLRNITFEPDSGGIVFSPDGKRKAVLDDGTILLWEELGTAPKTPTRTSIPGSTPVPSPTLSYQVTPVLTVTPHPGVEEVIYPNQGAILGLAYSTDGSRLTIVTKLGVLTYQDGELSLRWHWPSSINEKKVDISPDGNLVAITTFLEDEKGVELWSIASQKRIRLLQSNREDWVDTPTFSYNGQKLAASIGGSEIGIWEVSTGHLSRIITPETPYWSYYEEIAFSPDGTGLSAGIGDTLYQWDLVTNQGKEFEVMRPGSGFYDMEYSPDSKILVYSCGSGAVEVGFITFWNVAKEVWDDYWHEGKSTRTLAYEPNGGFIALGYYDGRLALWTEASGYDGLLGHGVPREHPWIPVDNDDRRVNALAFSPSGKYLASGSQDGSVILWDLTNLKPRSSLPACELHNGQTIHVRENARLWSVPNVSKGSVIAQLPFGQMVYVLGGPGYGPILSDGSLSDWFWEVNLTPAGESAGWLWIGQIQECQ
jgi:WD40 repeat protein